MIYLVINNEKKEDIMKTKILLLVFLTFCSVNLISQNASTQGIQPTYKVSLDEANDGQSGPVEGVANIGADEVLITDSLIAYGYVGYDPTNTLPEGPCFFDLDNPGLITSIAGTGSDFMPAGTWADGIWYGVAWVGGTGALYEINPFDGSMTYIGSSGYPTSGIAYDGITMYACSSNMFGSINLADGSGTIIGPMGNFGVMRSIACDSAGNIYGVDSEDDKLYSINKTTGAATVIGPLGIDLDNYAQDLDFDKDNDVLYLAGYVNNDGTLYTINTSTGAATSVGAFMNGAQICAFAIPYGDPVLQNDVGIVYISSPSSGMFFTDEEPVVVLINNSGINAQSNFDVSFTVDGGLPVTETVTATINSGETYEYTFTATIDLSAIGEHTVEVCTDLVGDENHDNNCMTKIVVNTGFDYCDASTVQLDEFISFVLCGSISNPSSWQSGVANYTDIFATIGPGMSEDISIINGVPYDNDSAAVWVDWNNDTIFQLNSEEEFILINDGTNEIFTGSIEVPAGTPYGDYRMRVRLVWNVTPDPCGLEDYGEIEDYTIRVDDATNIDTKLINNMRIYPNPASAMVNIKSDNLMEYITVYNQTGQKVFYREMNGNSYQLNTSGFLSGVYHFLIKTDGGTVSRRIVIK